MDQYKEWLYRLRLNRMAILTDGPTPDEQAAISGHWQYVNKLLNEGTLILAGRTQDTDPEGFGIIIFRADDEATARAIMENDPAVSNNVMNAKLFPYKVALINEGASVLAAE